MSEDLTKDIKQKYDTKPTIETVLERINALDQTLNVRIDKLQDQVNIRLDRIESEVKKTHSEFYDLRADFRELRSALIEHIPSLNPCEAQVDSTPCAHGMSCGRCETFYKCLHEIFAVGVGVRGD